MFWTHPVKKNNINKVSNKFSSKIGGERGFAQIC